MRGSSNNEGKQPRERKGRKIRATMLLASDPSQPGWTCQGEIEKQGKGERTADSIANIHVLVSLPSAPHREGVSESSDEEAAGLAHGFQKYINSVEPSVQFEDQVWERYLRQP